MQEIARGILLKEMRLTSESSSILKPGPCEAGTGRFQLLHKDWPGFPGEKHQISLQPSEDFHDMFIVQRSIVVPELYSLDSINSTKPTFP